MSTTQSQSRLISFVLPVYNEEKSLPTLHGQIVAVMERTGANFELVFVDDGSRDGSFAVLKELAARDTRVRVVKFRRNFGKAAAYSAGFSSARGEVVITLDTDLQDDPEDVPSLLAKLDEGYDLVSGWKYEGKGSLEKSLPSKLFNKVVRTVTKIPLHDFNCPLKAYRREVLREIRVYGELHRYIPVLANAKGFKIAEVKVKNLPRQHGTTNYGFERYLRGLLDLMTVTFITRFGKRPMHALAFGGILTCGLGASIVGFFVAAHLLFQFGVLESESWNIHERPLLSLALGLVIVGVQFFSMGLLAELLVIGKGAAGGDDDYSISETVGFGQSTSLEPPTAP